ncbi:menaquinone-dependent protoporphyrinogen IX dehydrogenase [Vagococcus carniphilus]|uniref:Protoporphyrinogen IX dehydrogenase [quinone] n=1 Tax=Vagococcus carniphilus TaxID=218144 RepID=A0A430AQ48_9ENTE|nr:menaquinone-dependent protoporphyrinogen IX dehydrogenase [Vagococcus carniphilus]QNN72895.1 menaquinone-dependent protoporphyrinogen IX dehydrogenase [Vagococcus carniphilus]RSU10064.1 hypothetical protein CBF28_14285 [Vagococcus carniphilus]
MPNILFAYSTVDGQTQKIAERLSREVTGKVSVKRFEEVTSIKDFDKVIVGSSIRYGKFPKKLYRFVEENQELLEERHADFYGVNLIARTPEKCQVENNVYVRKFLEKTTWKPKDVCIFAGALKYTTYRLFDKKMIQLIMKITKGPTDSRVDLEFTDWQQVTQFAERINQEINR